MKDDRETMLPSLRTLGDSLSEAARREIGAAQTQGAAADAPPTRQRWLRRHARVTGIVAGVALAAAGAATAGDLISSGEPVLDSGGIPADIRPGPGSASPILLSAPDTAAAGAWGIRTYRGIGGQACVTAGWIRGQALGQVEDGSFRAYPPDQAGRGSVCASVGDTGFSFTATAFAEPRPRTLVYGRARPEVTRLNVFDGKRSHSARVRAGVYLVVLSGDVDPINVRVTKSR